MKLSISKLLIIALLLSAGGRCFSQGRYQEQLFDSVDMQTHTYATKDGENLDLDIYTPIPDGETHRALIIYIHGGGFSGGSRNNDEAVNFCQKLAGYGFLAVSVSYRLTLKGKPAGFGCDCPAVDKLNVFQMAVEDIQDAVFWLIERHEDFGFNPQQIILAGSSAGAETAMNTAYQPPVCFGLESGPVSFAGVISFAGAIPDLDKIYDESAVPSLFFHGTCDELVPYSTSPHRYCDESKPGYLILHGSHAIARKFDELKKPYWLHTTCGGTHNMAGYPMQHYFDEIIRFCYRFVIRKEGETTHTIIPGDAENPCRNKYEQYDVCK